MSAPRSDRPEELSLQGTQVNIANRSHHKEKKNSQNSIMYSRPFSAIPGTYKKEKPTVSLAKRPLSADTIFCNDKKYESEELCLMTSDSFYQTLPMKDSNNEVPSFPSAQILKTLLSERVDRSWNNVENGLQKSTNFDTNSVDSVTDSEKSLGTKIQELAQRSSAPQGILVPGIKTKPPLPDKQKRKCESSTSAVEINIFKPRESETEFEQHEDKSCKENYYSQPLQTDNVNTISFRLADNCFVEDLEESDKSDQFYSISNDKEIKISDTKNEALSNTSIKNWIQENNDNIPELYNNEKKQIDTEKMPKQENLEDRFSTIESLFKYSGKESGRNNNNNNETTQNDGKLSSGTASKDIVTYMKNKPNNMSDKSTIIKNRTNKSNNPKNIQITRNDNKADKETNALNKKPRGILKPTVKLKKDASVEKNIKHNSVERKTSQKAEEQCDFENIDDNVKSWMSTNTGHESFLDFLNKLDDLENLDENVRPENTVLGNDLQEIPEHDLDNQNASTYDDIASILEVLEKEDLKSQKSIESLKEIINNEVSDSNNIRFLDTRSISTSSLESSSNYNEFLTYLDEIDQNCVKTLKYAKDRVKNVKKVTNSAMNVDTIPKLEDLLNYTNVELSHYVVDLSLRQKEKSAGITVLQAELSKLRALINSKSEEFEKCLKQKLHVQKDEYEAVIKRHQKFIDQLIADKKSLNKQCEGLISEMKVLEDRYNTNTRATEQRHKVELQKAKEMHLAAEKLRREKWIEGKTQKIKEMTVKSLEPELQNMTTRHQQELSDLRSLHKRELEDLELRAARKTQQQCEALRQQLAVEREAAIAHERDILRQRLEKLVEAEEKGYQEQRRRLNAEHAARTAECEERIVTITNEKDRAIEGIKREFDDKFETAQRRHKTEVKNIKESLDLEFEVWKNNHKKQQTIKLAEMEAQMRDLCKKERDREIELVIERLEQEASETKAQTEQAAENRLRRTKEKYEEEIKDLEKSVNEYKSKYSKTKEKLLNQEDTIINLSTSMKQLQSQLQQAKDVSDELSMDRTKMREQIKEEFLSEINALENEVKILKGSKEEELQKIFAKVKLTVAHKDELLTELTQNNANLQEKCTMLENLLEQQRKDYLIKQ